MDDIASPCTGVCRLDEASETCLGCLRTLDEVMAWGGLDRAGKRRVLARLAALDGFPATPGEVRAPS